MELIMEPESSIYIRSIKNEIILLTCDLNGEFKTTIIRKVKSKRDYKK